MRVIVGIESWQATARISGDVMSEVESRRSLNAQSATVIRPPVRRSSTDTLVSDQQSEAGNEDQPDRKLVPFPDGWYAGY